jgi:hypothetical protein
MSIEEKKDNNSSTPYLNWKKKVSVNQPGSDDLELIGAFFNAKRSIYLLCVSQAKSELFIAVYNIETSTLSKFKCLCKVDERMYTAAVYEETEQRTRWYILGKQNLWTLEVIKPNLNSGTLSTFTDYLFPLKGNYYQKVFDGASLVVFDRAAWIIGGSQCKDRNGRPLDTRSRVIVSGRWGEWCNRRKGGDWGGWYLDYLVHPREAPILHMYNKDIICIGGNKESQACIFETVPVRPYYWPHKYGTCREDAYTYLYTTERAITAYETLNCSITTLSPRPASCIFKEHIFIFSNVLFNEAKLYYKFHYAGGRGSGSGNGDWEFLTLASDFSTKDLQFTSAKAIAVGNSMYLVLFNAGGKAGGSFLGEGEQSGETRVSVFEIREV